MSLLQIASLLIVLAGVFGTINYLFLRLPSSIGILIVALFASIMVIATDALFPALTVEEQIRAQVLELEFSEALLEGMLGLLLFAGALHVKLSDLRKAWPEILLMATIGVGVSTSIVGVGFSWVTGMPLMIAFIFGALISPTDPVAVLGVLREANLPKSLKTKIAGESLFNDGVGYVVFLVLVGLAYPTGDGHGGGLVEAAVLFTREVLGGAVLGLVLGWLTFRVMRRIDDYSLEVLITLGLAFGGYELAVWLHVSAPIMAVCAGLLIGEIGTRDGRHVRGNPTLRRGLLETDRRDPERSSVPDDRVRGFCSGIRSRFRGFGPDGHRHRPSSQIRRHLGPSVHAEAFPDIPQGSDPHHDMGRTQGGHLRRTCPVVTRWKLEAVDPDGHLCRGDLLDHRAGVDRNPTGRTSRPSARAARRLNRSSTPSTVRTYCVGVRIKSWSCFTS